MSELIAPPAAGLYFPGLLTSDWIFLSGQGGFDPDTGDLVSDNIADQTAHAFRNVEVLLRGRRITRRHRFLAGAPERSRPVRRVQHQLRRAVPDAVKPVRSTVGSDLAAGMRVEVTVVARRPGGTPSPVTPAGR